MLVLVLDWTQCLLQGVGAPPAMMRGRMTSFQKNWEPGPSERQDKVDTICKVPLDCGTPTTRRLYPFGVLTGCCCCRPTPPACSCGGIRQLNKLW